MRGTISYVPLLALPSPLDLHDLDTAFQNLILAGMGVRSTVEHMSLLAARARGGMMQIPNVVESTVAAAAADLLQLLSGSTTASILGRDSCGQLSLRLRSKPRTAVVWLSWACVYWRTMVYI